MFWKKQADTQSTQISFQIEGMHCNSCAFTIDTALEDLAGVKEARTSYASGKIHVVYDSSKIDEKLIRNTIEELGYSVLGK